jgi:glycosyltransferase involved in cell wall biosynthesis
MGAELAVGRIGFLVKTYPKLSETFILEEILGLERLGVDLHIFSLNPPKDEVAHAAVKKVRARVSYEPSPGISNLPRSALQLMSLLLCSPIRCLRTVAFLTTRAGGGRWRDLQRACSIANAVSRSRVTHLHTHFISEPADVAELVHKLTGLPFSISAHAKDIYLSSPRGLKRKLMNARFTVTCTEYNRGYLASLADESVVRRMYHGVDPQQFAPNPAEPETRTPLILSVGRLREKKGFRFLIDACQALREAGQPFRCEIIGYGEEHDRLQHLIDRYRLGDCVVLIGKTSREQLIQRYRAATAFVLPCVIAADGDRDGIPNVLLEAMATALPVISTPVSGIPEVVLDEETGLIVPPADAGALARQIQRLLHDRALRRRLGDAARRLVLLQFSNDSNLRLLCDLLRVQPAAPRRAAEAATEKALQHVG